MKIDAIKMDGNFLLSMFFPWGGFLSFFYCPTKFRTYFIFKIYPLLDRNILWEDRTAKTTTKIFAQGVQKNSKPMGWEVTRKYNILGLVCNYIIF
jgi:hypothetical protein